MLTLLKYFFRVYKAEKLRKDILNQNPTCKIGYDFVVTAPQSFTLGLYVDIQTNCYLATNGGVSIGDYSQVSENCTIFSDEHLYDIDDYIPISNKKIKKPVTIEEFVIIGANVSILPGVTIGKGSFIGMGSVVINNIPPYSIALGNPARVIKTRNQEQFEKLFEEKKFLENITGNFKYKYVD